MKMKVKRTRPTPAERNDHAAWSMLAFGNMDKRRLDEIRAARNIAFEAQHGWHDPAWDTTPLNALHAVKYAAVIDHVREGANALLADIARQLGIGINDDPVAAIDELQRIKNEYREANTEFSKETHNLRITVKMQVARLEELREQLKVAQATIAQQSDWIKNHKKKEKAA